MKLIACRKKPTNPIILSETNIATMLNSGFGTSFKAMPDAEVAKFIEEQAIRGYVCYEFSHTGTYQSLTTVTKTAA